VIPGFSFKPIEEEQNDMLSDLYEASNTVQPIPNDNIMAQCATLKVFRDQLANEISCTINVPSVVRKNAMNENTKKCVIIALVDN
jgi:hypothetical protein